MHLNAEQLVDIAEGAQAESSAPHLADCEACRARLHGLRAMMLAASGVAVPEPSPLFWDHLSSRVHDAVEADAGDAHLTSVASVWRRCLEREPFRRARSSRQACCWPSR